MRPVNVLLLALIVVLGVDVMGCRGADVTGRMALSDGQPMADGKVLIFRAGEGMPAPMAERYARMPDSVAPLDSQGRFRLMLAEGQYYIGAMRRSGIDAPGPIRDQDSYLIVENKEKEPKIFAIPAQGAVDIGEHDNGRSLAETLGQRLAGDLASLPSGKKTQAGEREGWQSTILQGTIRDSEGNPVADVWVWATASGPKLSGSYLSDNTTATGDFLLRLPGAASYRLAVGDAHFSYKLAEPSDGAGAAGIEGGVVEMKEGEVRRGIGLVVRKSAP